MKDQVLLSFGTRLRGLRTQRNMTQLEFATAYSLDRSFISDMERGTKVASLTTLSRLATALDMSLSELLKGVEHGTATSTPTPKR